MKHLVFCLVLQVLSGFLQAQFSDDFSAPFLADHWLGDTAKFTLNNGELQLDDTAPGSNNTAVLYALAPTDLSANTTWSFAVRLAFAPSAANYARVYLATDQPPLAGADLQGYYVQIGGISGSDDAVELYRQDGQTSQLLISGQPGGVGSEPAVVSVSVSRSTDGTWTLETDYSGGEDYEPEGSALDLTYTQGLFFGVACTYTSSRASHFFFDDLFADPTVADDTPPAVLAVEASGPQQLRVVFNELLDPGTATLPGNFFLDQGGGNHQAAMLLADQTTVLLLFDQPFTNFTDYQLTVVEVADLSGNVLSEQVVDFQFLLPVAPAPGDLLVTEIMADPTPPVGLPQEEYLELHNRGTQPLQLGGLGLSTGGSPRELPDFVLLPGAYVTLCAADQQGSFAAYGPALGLEAFPALSNGGSLLELTTPDGARLLGLTYDESWYADPFRAEGGYSLELIDPGQASDCAGNWRASQSAAGGTPGQPNSLLGTPLETDPPSLRNAFTATATEIVLRFDEQLPPALTTDLFSLDPAIGIGDVLLATNQQAVSLFLESPLQEGVIYTVRVAPGLADCLGNTTAEEQLVRLGLARVPQAGELIINELLFNPYTGGADFVELRNHSDAILELQGLRLRNEAITSGTTGTVIEERFLLFPDSLVVFTPDPDHISDNYTVPNPAALVENDMPSLGDEEGNLSVYAPNFTLLDALDYSSDWHSPLLADEDGVSLERLRADGPTQSSGNWYSAASAAGYATPTGINSQDRSGLPLVTEADQFFSLPVATFSPDGDGYQDVLELSYQTSGAGFLADILIFDAQGRPIRQLQNQELLAGQGQLRWDGTDDDGQKARIGIYVILIELFEPSGITRREKHTCVLAGQLD
jgi:hypothetical protein